ncbi:MAG: class I fructose-bisphosphate aldolase [Lysobacterales bacterium]
MRWRATPRCARSRAWCRWSNLKCRWTATTTSRPATRSPKSRRVRRLDALYNQNVMLEGTILKASMVVPGKDCPDQASVEEAESTPMCLKSAGRRSCRASCSCPAARATRPRPRTWTR